MISYFSLVKRRYEATDWLRKTVGVVDEKDLPQNPSEDEFMYALRNGVILCNALNKIKPRAVPKVSWYFFSVKFGTMITFLIHSSSLDLLSGGIKSRKYFFS